jgi:Flp pilus assembly pilin Flp
MNTPSRASSTNRMSRTNKGYFALSVEYAVIVGLLAAALLGFLQVVGSEIGEIFREITGKLA